MRNIEPISLLEPNIISKERDFEDDEIRNKVYLNIY